MLAEETFVNNTAGLYHNVKPEHVLSRLRQTLKSNKVSVFTNLILPHFLQFVHCESLLLQTVQYNVAQVGKLAERVGEAPQPLVNHFTEGEQSVGHTRPPLPESNLEQSPNNPSGVLGRNNSGRRRS